MQNVLKNGMLLCVCVCVCVCVGVHAFHFPKCVAGSSTFQAFHNSLNGFSHSKPRIFSKLIFQIFIIIIFLHKKNGLLNEKKNKI
jgi:hypothetical protein